jgi:uncharacterized protein
MRFQSLDALRGFAVMGILLMNIIAFSMPELAYINPRYYGGTGTADVAVWGIMSVLVDSKMRGLFSILFGASMLLVYERAQASEGNGAQVHTRRMMWLFVFGYLHFILIWFGDILTLYAACGMAGMFLLLKDEAQLRRWAIILLSIGFAVMATMMLAVLALQYGASLPNADPELMATYTEMVAGLGQPDAAATAANIALHQSGWLTIVGDKLVNHWFEPIAQIFMTGPETLGLMALGMLLYRNGFLTGEWERARYVTIMRRCYLIGLPPLVFLAGWGWMTGFDAVTVIGTMMAWSMPFRIAVTLGHAALAMVIITDFGNNAFIARVAAAGRMAFSNYIGTSLLLTTIFYGYGFGWFGEVSRAQAYLVVPFVWAVMLLWSKPWLDRYRYGPLEWLWRSAARGQWQAMRK